MPVPARRRAMSPHSRRPRVPNNRPADQPIPGISADEEREVRDRHLAHGEGLAPDAYPSLDTMSAAFMLRFIPRPLQASPIEYVRVPLAAPPRDATEEASSGYLKVSNFVAQWNYAWEAGHLRQDIYGADAPPQLAWIRKYPDVDLRLVTDQGQRSQYDFYQSLYHLLPRTTLERHGLPLLKRGLWRYSVPDYWADRILPADADRRLEGAFAEHVWPALSAGSPINAFARDEPLRLLAHNLDFWEEAVLLAEARDEMPAGVSLDRPLKGGYVWMGEEEAREATRDMVEMADRQGRLRGIIEAIRSHRVEEDFSDRWSFAREDFARKLHAKRVRRVKISFVELTDTVPVHGRGAEADENLLWEDFFAVVDRKDRRIVVCLRNGHTRVGDIAKELGDANHSPVSKALARIRRRAERWLSE
jgi:hypothetical protein